MRFARIQRGHDGKAVFLALEPGEDVGVHQGAKVEAVWTEQRKLEDGLYLFGQDFDYRHWSLFKVICMPKRIYLVKPGHEEWRGSLFLKRSEVPLEAVDFYRLIGLE